MDIRPRPLRLLIALHLTGLLLSVCWISGYAQGSGYSEKLLSETLRETIKTGKVVDLMLGNQQTFLAIYTEAFTSKSRGCVILIHGLNGHLDWPEIIHPLRTELPKYGWNTLSLQLGAIGTFQRGKDYQALYRDSSNRLAAAIDYIKQRGIDRIVVVGHSLGASMALYHLASGPSERNQSVIAFAAISMYDPDGIAESFSINDALLKIKIPVLDIVGALDRENVLISASKRKAFFADTGKVNLQQMIYSGGDHFLTGLQQSVGKHIRAWANKQAPSMEINSPADKDIAR